MIESAITTNDFLASLLRTLVPSAPLDCSTDLITPLHLTARSSGQRLRTLVTAYPLSPDPTPFLVEAQTLTLRTATQFVFDSFQLYAIQSHRRLSADGIPLASTLDRILEVMRVRLLTHGRKDPAWREGLPAEQFEKGYAFWLTLQPHFLAYEPWGERQVEILTGLFADFANYMGFVAARIETEH